MHKAIRSVFRLCARQRLLPCVLIWACVCSERPVLFLSDFQTNQRISALEDAIAGLRQEPNTPNAIAVGLGTREKRSTSNNPSTKSKWLVYKEKFGAAKF